MESFKIEIILAEFPFPDDDPVKNNQSASGET